MSRTSIGFERSFARHLVTEQRKAVLAALRDRIGPEHTVGEVLDAADALGWGEPLGDLSLSELAEALLTPAANDHDAAASPSDDAEADEQAEADASDEARSEAAAPANEAAAARKGASKKGAKKTSAKKTAKKAAAKKTAKKAAAKKTAKKAAAKKTAKKAAAKKTAKTGTSKKATAKAAPTGRGKKAGKSVRGKTTLVDFDDRMSLDEAAAVLVPLVKSVGEATMQDIEDRTAGGRRKLRFHIGQLVKQGYLERHGMGRGTYYTVA